MMSLQVIAFCYILMMLAIPTTIYLLMAIKKGKKPAEEVKPRNNHDYKCEVLTLQQTFGTGAVGYTTNLSEMFKEKEYKNFLSFQALDVLKQIEHIQENPVDVNWEEWEDDSLEETNEIQVSEEEIEPVNDFCHRCGERSRLGVTCEKCLDKEASVEATASDDFLYRLQEELEITSHVLLRKPMRSRKKGYGKSIRVNGRTLKAQWTR